MRKNRCSLCGGKLVNNRCTECGLDHTKNDEKSPSNYKIPQNRKAKKSRGSGKIYLFLFIGIFGFLALIAANRMNYSVIYEDWDTENPYRYVTRELSEEGEDFEIVLEPGRYEVGVHIPEGVYTAEVEERRSGYVNLNDSENDIYYFIDFQQGNETRQEDIRLYDGAMFEVSQRLKVKMYSENAQTVSMHTRENPLVQEVTVTSHATSGVDFEPGTYDITFTATESAMIEEGTVNCTPSIEDMEKGVSEQNLYFNDEFGGETYHNVYLPAGTTVVIDGLSEVKMTPSPKITSDI